jgi:hypothetical protein
MVVGFIFDISDDIGVGVGFGMAPKVAIRLRMRWACPFLFPGDSHATGLCVAFQ